jgi:hypothetical protein
VEGETEVVGVRTGEDSEVRDRRAMVEGLKSGACEESWLEGGDRKHFYPCLSAGTLPPLRSSDLLQVPDVCMVPGAPRPQ